MNKRRVMWSIVTVGLVLAMSFGATPLAVAAPGAARQQAVVVDQDVDTFVRSRLEALGIPGAAVAVVKDGQTLQLAGYGDADPEGRPVTPDTPFLLGSTSKVFTSTAVLTLVKQGRLSLDTKVLPFLKDEVSAVPDGFGVVTVRELLTHTSGLSMSNGLAGTYDINEGSSALAMRVRDILSQPLAHQPGTKFEYSNAGFVLLAAVVEAVTHTTFGNYVDQTVFVPLGMTASFATNKAPAARDLAIGHRLWFNHWFGSDLPYDSAGAAMGFMGSTAADMARFMNSVLDDPTGGGSSIVDLAEAISTTSSTGWNVPLEGNYGMGWFVDTMAGHRVIRHSGSIGDFTAHLILVPSLHLGITVLSNASAFVAAGHEGQYDVSLGLAKLLLGLTPTPHDRSWVTTLLLPCVLWAGLLLVAADGARLLFRPRRNPATARRPRHMRAVLLSLTAFAIGLAIVLSAPLASARYFYPDVGWGSTFLMWALFASAAIRLLVLVPDPVRRRSSRCDASRLPRDRVSPTSPLRSGRPGHPTRPVPQLTHPDLTGRE